MFITEYESCYAKTVKELDREVNEYIARGWQPLGAPYMSNQSYIQTMVKYDTQVTHDVTNALAIKKVKVKLLNKWKSIADEGLPKNFGYYFCKCTSVKYGNMDRILHFSTMPIDPGWKIDPIEDIVVEYYYGPIALNLPGPHHQDEEKLLSMIESAYGIQFL